MLPLPVLKATTHGPSNGIARVLFDLVSQAAGVVALVLIRGYKIAVSPLFTGSCRFHPSCSDYTAEAIQRLGVWRGVWLGLRRLSRCHPFGGHGVDPVPHV
jgi:putative membrane protein insertion efficiency factor